MPLNMVAPMSMACSQKRVPEKRSTNATRPPAMRAGYAVSTWALLWNSGRHENQVSACMSSTVMPRRFDMYSSDPRAEK